jgi:P-type Cu+ transporter
MPGITPKGKFSGRFNFLENEEISDSLLDFKDGELSVVTLNTPSMHCSSCIWLLENISQLNDAIVSSQVDFPKKRVRITFNNKQIKLNQLADLMAAIGYEPVINLNDLEKDNKTKDRSLIYQVGLAGFAFGNIMLLALPEYFEVNEYWLDQFKPFFRYIMMALAIPVMLYSAKDYFISAYKGIKHKYINIDVPIALGIVVLFVRSSYEVISGEGSGYFDSLAGLVFFLLLGKFFQDKTYKSLSFDRDYKSYFPVAVTVLKEDKEENVQVSRLIPGDRILIRNEELIPADCILMKGEATIDNSFVTGESRLVEKQLGDKIFAGGKQVGEAIELEVVKTVSQSYLTQLWNNDVFEKSKHGNFKNLTDSISKYFTLFILALGFASSAYWFYAEGISTSIAVFSAVLIVACPCALALSAPFTFGNVLRIFGRNGFYVKNTNTLEEMSKLKNIVFDKTGTITESDKTDVTFHGEDLSNDQLIAVKSIVRQSNHPLSRMLYNHIFTLGEMHDAEDFNEIKGSGMIATVDGNKYLVGSAKLVNTDGGSQLNKTKVYISIDSEVKGYYLFENKYRFGIESFFESLKKYDLSILSGDNEGEKKKLQNILPSDSKLMFNQKPDGKLNFIKSQQEAGNKTMMVGDGLNDAGALMQSNVGISVSENINTFSPACDAILDANEFEKLPRLLDFTIFARKVVISSFILSFLYNSIGLYFAVSAMLSPIIAAILMPISSISVVVFVTLVTNLFAKKYRLS